MLQDRNLDKVRGMRRDISLDLNIIDNIWIQMEREQRIEQVTSMAGLHKIMQKVLNNLNFFTPAYLEKLYESVSRCMAAVFAQEGGHT